MRLAPQEGQNPRFLQLNATSFSAWACSSTRRSPGVSPRWMVSFDEGSYFAGRG